MSEEVIAQRLSDVLRGFDSHEKTPAVIVEAEAAISRVLAGLDAPKHHVLVARRSTRLLLFFSAERARKAIDAGLAHDLLHRFGSPTPLACWIPAPK